MITNRELRLNGFTFAQLQQAEGLARLDAFFLAALKEKHPEWQEKLLAYRAVENAPVSTETSELLINCATFLESFLATFFDIEEAVAAAQVKTTSHNPIAVFKKYFILRRAKKELNKAASLPSFAELNNWLNNELQKAPLKAADKELGIALLASQYLSDPDQYQSAIEQLVQWCVQALASPEGRQVVSGWSSFRLPERLDYDNLVPTELVANDTCERRAASEATLRLRDGFALTDPRMSARDVQDEVNYCIYCHDHEGDFCSKGFPVKKGDPSLGLKKNPLAQTLTGCPLEEKISEMQQLKKDGYTLGSLAMVMVDNPMCPATGHRICNDCMKACVYQKQDPVNIPQIETRVLTDVLDLPWGVEIYDLLTRWNPLRQTQYVMKPYNGLKILIAGMGPAGFTLAHHLLLEGCAVVGFDGLKIESLPDALIKQPIYRFADLKESLNERLMAGFGGVAEYGITVRWDKNFLKLIYLSLVRRPHFQVFGGVRFGGTLTVEDAWELGFDHLAVAVGAGLPKALPIPHSLAPGMRQANDFLMALQLGNATKASSLTNLQVRLPAVVIGGGLTGVDTATEIQAYYIAQVEKILFRYETLVSQSGKEAVHQHLDPASESILAEFLAHGQAVRAERARAKELGVLPDFIKLTRQWGGVTIAYRRSMQESPAYIHNHDELKKALEEGIYYAEGLEPMAVDLNEFGHVATLICHKRIRNEHKEWVTTSEEVRLPAQAILAATGTQPNTAYEFEYRGTFHRLKWQYQHYEDHDGELAHVENVAHCKEPNFGPFTSYHQSDYRVSLIGDTHPVFHGSVVKAIASGMRTYPKIMAVLQANLSHSASETEYHGFAKKMDHLFHTKIIALTRQTDQAIEITVQAPLAAKNFQPGQFFRLQNFETLAPRIDHTLLQMEPLAVVAAECDKKNGTITVIVHENSATAKLCATLKPNEPVSFMGPTGVRAKIGAERETVLIVGDQSSFAFARSYGQAARKSGHRVIYACQLNSHNELFSKEKLKAAADVMILQVKNGVDILTALQAYGAGDANWDQPDIPLFEVDRVFVVGDTTLLRRFQSVRPLLFKQFFHKNPKVFGSVYGNMQCMLKGVCAQCLQWQIDPETGLRTKAVFACSWQDQPLELIDINHIDERNMQNHLLDHISHLWVEHLFQVYQPPRI